MRQQLRARVILPVAVLGLLGAGVGAFAYGKPPADESTAYVTTHATTSPAATGGKKGKHGAKSGSKKPAPAPTPRPAKTALEDALRAHRAAVVVLYTPGGGVDNDAVREARAGADAVDQGFMAINVEKNASVAKYYEKYGVRTAPAALVFIRGPRLAARFEGFADRDTVAQAVSNALR
jgi:hypothetical protein